MIAKSKADEGLFDSAELPAAHRRRTWLFAALAALAVFLPYLPSLNHPFVNWDDPEAIINNPLIRSLDWESLRNMFLRFHSANWMPLTWLSYALDYQIGGLRPEIYRLHNLILHALNTVLVFLLSLRILVLARKGDTRVDEEWRAKWMAPAAFLAALLFGLHPVHVETVAWATERNGLLCGLFFFSSLLFYLDYAGRAGRRTWKYGACLFMFLLALASKPAAITLPLIMILLDGWPLGRLVSERRLVFIEKIPFFIAALLSGWLTVLAQSQAGTIATLESVPSVFRVMNAFHSLIFYLWKMAAPIGLAALYPIQLGKIFSIEYIGSVFIVILVSLACFYYRKQRPCLAVAWLYYLLTLAPVLGLAQTGGHAAADRYTYLPSLGLFLLAASGAAIRLENRRRVFVLLALGLVIVLGYGTLRQASTWKDSVSLWENAARVSPGGSIVIQMKLGNAYQEEGRWDDAIREYDRAIVMAPEQAEPHNWKGSALYSKGLVPEAVREFKAAIERDPRNPLPRGNLCVAFQRQGLFQAALTEAQEAVRLAPGLANAQNNLGICYLALGQKEKAVAVFEKAVSLAPGHPQYLANLADTYSQAGRPSEAIPLYQKAIAVNPAEVNYYFNLGYAYYQKGLLDKAVEALQAAAKIQPQNPWIYQRLGLTHEKAGRADLAAENFAKAKALQSGKK